MKKSVNTTRSSRSTPQPKPKGPPKLDRQSNPVELLDVMWERIAQKAYELYEQRGMQDGQALDDWLEAEAIVMEEIHEARK